MSKSKELIGAFGTNLRKYRNRRGFSQRELFHISGIDHGMISRIENGQINITLNTLFLLAEALNVPCWKLLVPMDEEDVAMDYLNQIQTHA